MTVATIKNVNKEIAKYGVELVKDFSEGYFYFADIGEDFVADRIDSVFSNTIKCSTKEEWVAYVEGELAAWQ